MTLPLSPMPGRADMPPGGTRPGRPHHDLIAALRAASTDGEAAMAAGETYDLDLPVRLSGCPTPAAMEAVLRSWLEKRVGTLEHTQAELRRIWLDARAHPDECP